MADINFPEERASVTTCSDQVEHIQHYYSNISQLCRQQKARRKWHLWFYLEIALDSS